MKKIGHILFGIHSNIPLCCVFSWVNGGRSRYWTEEAERIRREAEVNYVPCGSCIKARNFRTLHICHPSKSGCLKVIRMLDTFGWNLGRFHGCEE